jgi:hypothetical protein
LQKKNRAKEGPIRDRDYVRRGLKSLKRVGLSNDDIAVLFPGVRSTGTGLVIGGIAGGVVTVLIAFNALAAPMAEVLLSADPFAKSLAGVASGGAVGGFIGALIGLRLPEEKVQFHGDAQSAESVDQELWVCRSAQPKTAAHRAVARVKKRRRGNY